ncbi:type II toxin-antitoxin system HicA family toxin [Sulfurovum sp. zt1-1]|uniref:Type II toxin-antitoxin system HicA family toxin n=1 Tax=Sulfurovum zhangzhouensis TaxID=3019067 RepID=A0ABT7R0N8_9BACT|nr:type II toxin-antitoxin system HicA family toxin [Sulfurovum zhangzhouensis]MDM5272061.1 type II toxin-antitoxin system HicA family toxin [Sulfurovum zhangzhouensis]
MDAKEVLKVLLKEGFKEVSQKGSHKKLIKGDKTVIVAIHGAKDIPIGTLKGIEKQCGVKLR